MITKEIREWMQKVKLCHYSYEDAMHEFLRFSSYLTIDEMKMIKEMLKNYN